MPGFPVDGYICACALFIIKILMAARAVTSLQNLARTCDRESLARQCMLEDRWMPLEESGEKRARNSIKQRLLKTAERS